MIKDEYLKLISNDFEALSKLVLRQMEIAGTLIDTHSDSLFVEAEENEDRMDMFDLSIRDKIVFAILQFNPKAENMRFIITYYDIAKYLERIGDLQLNVIHFLKTSDLQIADFRKYKNLLKEMTAETEIMLKTAVSSYIYRESKVADKALAMDDIIDDFFRNIYKSLQTDFKGKTLSEMYIKNLLNINQISQNLERIGDNAANIAESTVFLTEGEDIRHNKG
jgi:phosphate transport system protein